MLKLGIVGAENSHSYSVAKTCNIDKAVAMRVPMIWGETSAYAKNASELGGIPTIVKDWREMLGQVDGIMIDHRHPGPHYEVAKYFLSRGVPSFVDKPLTWKLTEAKKLLDIAKKNRTPVTTFSAIPIQTAFSSFKSQVEKNGGALAFNSTGPVDLKAKWGGVFFYGIHQVDAIVEVLGTNVQQVLLQRNGVNGIATLLFTSGRVATINCIKAGLGFSWQVTCKNGSNIHYNDTRDANPYMTTVKRIRDLIGKGKQPYSRKRMLAPVAILEALQKSLDTGKVVKVAKF